LTIAVHAAGFVAPDPLAPHRPVAGSSDGPDGPDGTEDGTEGTEDSEAGAGPVRTGPVAPERPAPTAKSYPQPSQNRPVRGVAQSGQASPDPAAGGAAVAAPFPASLPGAVRIEDTVGPVMRVPQTSQ
jgi:hypothetical protein